MEKKVHIFISYSYQNKKVAYDVAGNIKDMSVKVGVEDIPIGGNIERSIKKLIGNSLVCFVIIGNNISHTQKSEIKEMLKQKKKIIPIIVSRNANMPYVLKDINPITLDEFMAKPYSLFN